MAVTGIRGVNSPNIIIESSVSVNGFSIKDNSEAGFGIVKVIAASSLKYTVGDVVFFNKKNAVRFQNGTTVYFVLNENDVLFTESEAL